MNYINQIKKENDAIRKELMLLKKKMKKGKKKLIN